ncbi:hypothetical protein OD917_18790 [Flavobacterium sp. SH_e]|uniref:hypothetical protein n=1 Tax=Flavobacterium TaxID=237 RepID=UPI0021E4F66A|nr:hypothetical protein [Flavobacterium sp. SH_e]MCV2486986.1 hypothetical protein [Flavobacterium sp. SH_e]
MYFLSSTFQNINNFKFINDCGLFYVTKDEKLYKNKEFLIDCFGIEYQNNILFCFSNITNPETFLITNCNIIHYDFAIYHETFDENSAIIKNKKNDVAEKYGVYDFNDNSIYWLKNLKAFGQSFRFNNNLIHRQGHTYIKSFSLLLDLHQWELDLSGRKYTINSEEHEAKIIRLLGFYNNQLLVFMQGDILVSIDINNGKILSETMPFEGLLNVNGFQITDFRDLKLDVKSGKIFMLNKHYYYEIDLNTFESKQLKSFFTGNSFEVGRLSHISENAPKDILINQSIYTEDYIYFIGGYSLSSNVVGAFNRTTYEIDWQETIDLWQIDRYNNLKDIQYANDKLYVLDTNGTLRIFENKL